MEPCDCFETNANHDDLLVKYQYISDALIALAYFSIPLELIYFVNKSAFFPYKWVLMQFGAFIILCGATHFINLWMFFNHSKVVAIVMTLAKVSCSGGARFIIYVGQYIAKMISGRVELKTWGS